MRKIEFVKMHGLGNDFILLDNIKKKLPISNPARLAISICNRRIGIGADGLIVMLPSRLADFRMRIFNSDGSEAEMCGNGLRCMVRYLRDQKYSRKSKIDIQTLAGIIRGEIAAIKGRQPLIKVAMGMPNFKARQIPVRTRGKYFINAGLEVGGRIWSVTSVSMGNPHTVLFVDSLEFDWRSLGPRIETHKIFPERTNVEFVKVQSRHKIIMRSWERGAGPTLASGTGASAAVAAGIMTGQLDRNVEVAFELGSLQIEWEEKSNLLYKTGPAEYICTGSFDS